MSSTDTQTDDSGHFGQSVDDTGGALQDAVSPVDETTAAGAPEASDGGADDGRGMGHLDPAHEHGPTDGQYFTVFWILLGLTVLEVSTYWWPDWFGDTDAVRYVATTVLFALMFIKFVMIAGIFMHLKFDPKILRRVFIFGVLFALAIYLIALSSMNFWTDSGIPWFNDPPPAIVTTTVPEGG